MGLGPKKDNSFWSHENSKLTLWRWGFFSRHNMMVYIFVRPHTTQNEAPISDSAPKTASCLNDWSKKSYQIVNRHPSVSSTVCLVRMQVTWCYYMMLLLHGAIRVFVISCFANICTPFLNLANLRNVSE